MLKIHFALLIVLLMILLSVQSMHIEESHENLKGTDSYTGLTVEYGCYKSYCRAFCNGLDKKWCYTNKKNLGGRKSCTTDKQCNGYFSRCVGPCGI